MKLITYYQTGKIDVFDTATFTVGGADHSELIH